MITTLPDDTSRLLATVDFVKEQDTAALLPLLFPGLDGPELRTLVEHCRFSHAALLVFPADEAELRALLSGCGLDAVAPPRPSVVVRERLAVRHRRPAADLDVGILRPRVLGSDGERRTVEVFALTVAPGSGLDAMAAHERAHEHETHVAFDVASPSSLVLRGLCATFARYGATPDGGGYNPHENGTVFYFGAAAEAKVGYRRVELYVPGDHRDVLAAHLDEHRARQPAETLLRLMTGAWTTQALAVFAQLGVPDAMETERGTHVEELAEEVGARPRNLATLLRYLAMLGAVTEGRDGFRLTEVGALLRAGAPGSMRALALMYGGPFYESFAALGHTVRTGRVGFEHRFGENHFDHFARDPHLAELFDRSMAAGAAMFDPVPTHPALTVAAEASNGATVVDVAGGNGELLGRVLAAHPRLSGVLLERPHAVEAARLRLEKAGLGGRCAFLAGDFADVPAGGDVYLLSRVLHDWDDERCREILRHCARAMPDHADLLVVERVLPSDGSASLAIAWDLHMMCNVGGRERQIGHYGDLFADAGLTLVDRTPLPLDGHVLHVRKAGADPDPM
ncbi:putative methyltransferase [Streptomyces scabiei 87.22]|uniref:Putative methyltransferase n=1 Tax=Streptomyces scabiei (strain 87.22) TaxID=680198 RepID=C9Z6F1_STRSW|nr:MULTISPECIES: methyltransferase [Streptomyces]MBP5865965.1 methyltransferase [Streptomyces sp. LBUM 1484]MBP5934073.1 methyltransferase [Streptomyces sp. LBUM 1479]MBP5873299.1 methyltransferase [Streptomyces sp. LBUM 1477]MBP5880979.1 methyltransferase [Streptomyces sp. LBUM 1487]MBP5896135.1 methyltransferase [Streptomyces sp. LBUM 1481]